MIRFLAHINDDVPVPGRTACVAEYDTGPADDDHSGLTAPLANLGKVRFHTDLDYLRQEMIVTSRDPGQLPLEIAAIAPGGGFAGGVVLFEHGLGYAPLVCGSIEVDGYVQPGTGSVMPIPGGNPANMGYRWLDFTADASKVYLYVRSFMSPAMTVHWKVRLLGERWRERLYAPDDLIRFDPSGADIIGFGKIDTDHRFLRRVTSGTGPFRVIGAQTMSISAPSGSVRQINFSDGQTHAARGFVGGLGASALTPALAASGVECEVSGGSSARGAGFHWDETDGITLAAAADDVIWTSKQAAMVSLGEIAASVTTARHDAVDNSSSGLHVIDHDLGPVPAGTAHIEGWAKLVSGGSLPPSLPFPFSGSVLMLATAGVSGSQISILAFQIFSPRIADGHAWLREEWLNYSTSGGYMPPIEVQLDLRCCAFVGGD